MKKTKLLYFNLLTILMIATGCEGARKEINAHLPAPNVVKFEGVQKISMIALIANPEKYNGCLVRLKGFLNLEFEGDGLYLHKDDYELGISKNGLWLEVEGAQLDLGWAKRCNRQYVILEGTFQMENKGHMASFSGSLNNITRIDRLSH